MFFFRIEGGMWYVAVEPYGNGFISMGAKNRGTEENPVYYFDGRYTDHMIESSMVDQVHGLKKQPAAYTKRLLKQLSILEKADIYSYENTQWIVKRI